MNIRLICLVVITLLATLIFLPACHCCNNSDDDCNSIAADVDDDTDDQDDDDAVFDDDDSSHPCASTASHKEGRYFFPIWVTISSGCQATIHYQQERFDGSGDAIVLISDSPVHDIYIDRDTTLSFHAETDDGYVEQEHVIEYKFPPKFRGIMSAYGADQKVILQWDDAWDSDGPITYNIYQPENDAPIPTLYEIHQTDLTEIVIDSFIIADISNGTAQCFVVRAQDALGMEDLNYIEYCINPQPVIYVNAAAPAGGDGSMATPFNSIQQANDSFPSSRYFTNVYVAGGTYVENLDFNNNDPPITTHIRAAQIIGGFDPLTWRRDLKNNPTIIDGDMGYAAWLPGEWDMIDGFHITNAGVGLWFDNSMSITIRNCFIHNNSNYGILIEGTDLVAGPSITASMIHDNGVGIGLTAEADSDSEAGISVLLRNLIVYGNRSMGIHCDVNGGGPFDTIMRARIRNIIVANNERGFYADMAGTFIDAHLEIFNNFIGQNGEDIYCGGCPVDSLFIEFCDIMDPGTYTGYGLIAENPEFEDPPFDFMPAVGSPLVDAGSPDWLFDDPDRTRNDIGAFGGIGGSWTPMPFAYEVKSID